MENLNFLKIPLYKLYYIKSVDDFPGLGSDDLASLKSEYTPDELESIVSSLEWASRNPNFEFTSLLPKLGHSNADIYRYLCKVYQSLSAYSARPQGAGNGPG